MKRFDVDAINSLACGLVADAKRTGYPSETYLIALLVAELRELRTDIEELTNALKKHEGFTPEIEWDMTENPPY